MQLWTEHKGGFIHAWHEILTLLWLPAATVCDLEPEENLWCSTKNVSVPKLKWEDEAQLTISEYEPGAW